MSVLTRRGYIVESRPETRRDLTVRAIENALGMRPPAFKVFKECVSQKNIVVPRFYGEETFGQASRDARPEPTKVSISFTGKLREHQIEALDKYPGYGVLSLDTGLGKTVCALAIATRMGVRTMIIVHKEFLANQWIERIRQFCPGSSIGRVQQEKCELDHPFVIAMIQTLCMRAHDPKTFETIGLVIVDEAHHVGAPAFSQAMFTMCPRYTLGLTATPDRKDGLTRLLYWFLGPCFFSKHRTESNNVQVHAVRYMDPEYTKSPPVSRIGKVCLATMVNMLVELPGRNTLLLDVIRSASRRHAHVLVLSDRRSHCEWIVKHLSPHAGLYMGGMKQEELDESAKKPIVVGTFSLAHEGLDIATLSALVMVTPHSDVRQAVGRILRAPGPKDIYDIVDTWSVLNAMYRRRQSIYRTAGFQTERDDESSTASIFETGKCLIQIE
jgi:superfamily II DNA or RNA helicase